jgi:hypothetical protein
MDRSAFVETVRDENRTELSRLGSSKSVYADTEGEMDTDAVLAAAAGDTGAAAETFEGWAGGNDGAAGAAFAAAADHAREQYESITAELGGEEPGDRPAVVAAVAEQNGDVQRLGALVGWTLVAEAKAGQRSGFFTGQADPGTASLFRGFGDDYEAVRAAALDTLAELCSDDAAWERATTAATGTVEAAYDEYVERLEAMGVNPKPVC